MVSVINWTIVGKSSSLYLRQSTASSFHLYLHLDAIAQVHLWELILVPFWYRLSQVVLVKRPFSSCCCCLFREKATRLQYYLQLRDNLLHYNQSVTEEKCFLLAGLALQADFGNFDQDRHVGAYFDPREFFPSWVSQCGESVHLVNDCFRFYVLKW